MLSNTIPMSDFETLMAASCFVDIIYVDSPFALVFMNADLALFSNVVAS
jgi:hypothetical protein